MFLYWKKKALFFCRADKFSDPFEGSVPQKEVNYRLFEAKKATEFYNVDFDLEKAKSSDLSISNLHKELMAIITVNCWHINENESDAMWQLYLKDSEGVAIETNVYNLELAFKDTNEIIQPSKVRYIDYDNDGWYDQIEFPYTRYNMEFPIFHKRIEFAHENEFRLYHKVESAEKNPEYWDNQINHKGCFIPIDIDILVSKIYFHPKVDNSTKEKIRRKSMELGYDFSFLDSKLSNNPVY